MGVGGHYRGLKTMVVWWLAVFAILGRLTVVARTEGSIGGLGRGSDSRWPCGVTVGGSGLAVGGGMLEARPLCYHPQCLCEGE